MHLNEIELDELLGGSIIGLYAYTGNEYIKYFFGKGRVQRNLIKKETLAQIFPLNFAKFLRTPVLQNKSGRLLLLLVYGKKYNHCTEPDI